MDRSSEESSEQLSEMELEESSGEASEELSEGSSELSEGSKGQEAKLRLLLREERAARARARTKERAERAASTARNRVQYFKRRRLQNADSNLPSVAWNSIMDCLVNEVNPNQDLASGFFSPVVAARTVARLACTCKEMYCLTMEVWPCLAARIPEQAWQSLGAETENGKLATVWDAAVSNPVMPELQECARQVGLPHRGTKALVAEGILNFLHISEPVSVPAALLFAAKFEKDTELKAPHFDMRKQMALDNQPGWQTQTLTLFKARLLISEVHNVHSKASCIAALRACVPRWKEETRIRWEQARKEAEKQRKEDAERRRIMEPQTQIRNKLMQVHHEEMVKLRKAQQEQRRELEAVQRSRMMHLTSWHEQESLILNAKLKEEFDDQMDDYWQKQNLEGEEQTTAESSRGTPAAVWPESSLTILNRFFHRRVHPSAEDRASGTTLSGPRPLTFQQDGHSRSLL